MRLHPILWAVKGNTRDPVPFQEILPLKLRATVSGKGDKTTEVCCIYEMSVMFSCLKENEFAEAPCFKEINAFQKCYTDHTKKTYSAKEKEAKGILVPGEKKLSHKQLNKLLKMYPNIK